MANSITGWNTFNPLERVRSSPVNDNFEALRDMSPLWQKYTVRYTDFTALGATATGSVTLFTLAANETADAWIVKHSTAFAGSVSAAVVKVGKSGTTDQYTDEFNVLQAVSASAHQKTVSLGTEFSATAVLLTMSCTGGNLAALTQGEVDVYVKRAQLPS